MVAGKDTAPGPHAMCVAIIYVHNRDAPCGFRITIVFDARDGAIEPQPHVRLLEVEFLVVEMRQYDVFHG